MIGRRDSPNGTLAFLVHSTESVAKNMPPEIDNKALARQKRRRTSKEDEDILKSEYVKNPKPDKAARLEIVSRVALGEKEVQVWFQNKRQNDRRKSRPLEPSSSASLMSSSSNMSDPPSEEDLAARDHGNTHKPRPKEQPEADFGEAALTSKLPTEQEPHELSSEISGRRSTELTTQTASEATTAAPSEPTVEPLTNGVSPLTTTAAEVTEVDEATATTLIDASLSKSVAASQTALQNRTSWISNRRSASFLRNNDDYAPETITFPNASAKPLESPENTTTETARSLKRTHSFVRISTNEDGTARIVTDLDKTPSPPHTKKNAATFSRAAAGLRRSYSAASLNEQLVAASRGEPLAKVARVSSGIGRSNDSRNWEFWCDPDSRNTTSLTTRAEQEGSGSAADAIGILRANRKILAQTRARQNTSLSRHSSQKVIGSTRVKKFRGPMQRAATVNGRFSTKEYQKNSDDTESDEMPQTESDKENWEPDTPQSVRKHYQVSTPPAARRARKILGENVDIMSQRSSIGALLARDKGRIFEDPTDPEQDDELRQFMKGDGLSSRSNLNTAEEAGCVEGLLKLSQGQWR